MNYSLDIIPLSEMRSIEMKTNDQKNGFKFLLATYSDDFMFKAVTFENMQLWVMVLSSGIIQENQRVEKRTGGNMQNPTKAGYLKRNKKSLRDQDKRNLFFVIKDQYMCCYNSQQDYLDNKVLRRVDNKTASVRLVDRMKCKFILTLPDKEIKLQAESEEEMLSWIAAIQESIKLAIQRLTDDNCLTADQVKDYIYQESSNKYCADCEASNPEWVAINLGITFCGVCATYHRKISTDHSKVKSMTLDSKWTPSRIKVSGIY